jgi:flagellar hook-associated protein 1 FlgK
MLDFSIGLSGLQVAQRAIELVGNNIANVSTEGYHRQELRISSLPSSFSASIAIGGGSEITAVTRQMDWLLEMEMLRQQPQQGQVTQQLETLRTIEGALGNVSTNGLNQAISGFFNSLRELASQPDSQAFQEQALWAGESLAGEFRNLAQFFTTLGRHILSQAAEHVQTVNSLAERIAAANQEIQSMNTRGGNSAALIWAVSCVAETKVVVRLLPFH